MARNIGGRISLLTILLLCALITKAQDDPEYKMEAGAGAGLVAYTGDFNGNLLKGMQPWGTLIAKYHLSPRAAVAFNLGMGKIKGSSDKAETWLVSHRAVRVQQHAHGGCHTI